LVKSPDAQKLFGSIFTQFTTYQTQKNFTAAESLRACGQLSEGGFIFHESLNGVLKCYQESCLTSRDAIRATQELLANTLEKLSKDKQRLAKLIEQKEQFQITLNEKSTQHETLIKESIARVEKQFQEHNLYVQKMGTMKYYDMAIDELIESNEKRLPKHQLSMEKLIERFDSQLKVSRENLTHLKEIYETTLVTIKDLAEQQKDVIRILSEVYREETAALERMATQLNLMTSEAIQETLRQTKEITKENQGNFKMIAESAMGILKEQLTLKLQFDLETLKQNNNNATNSNNSTTNGNNLIIDKK